MVQKLEMVGKVVYLHGFLRIHQSIILGGTAIERLIGIVNAFH